jgi:hypothetical protein
MIIYFAPANFIGKNSDDNTLQGLFRRMIQAGNQPIMGDGSIGLNYVPEAGDQDVFVSSVENHFGCTAQL